MSNRKIYAGIGSRKTDVVILSLMHNLARDLAQAGWVLRSGHAEGADKAFEAGCDEANGAKEIFLPWPRFNGSGSPLDAPSREAHIMASGIHPGWKRLPRSVRLMHARNCHQVLGENLDDPVAAVVCWTLNGQLVGGTRTGIVLAQKHNIPVYNLAIIGLSDICTSLYAPRIILDKANQKLADTLFDMASRPIDRPFDNTTK